MNNIKKYTQKDRYGNSMSFEFDVPPMGDHPGIPVGTDTVPAWLTPGEFVMNAEATRMFKPQIEAMNNQGQAMQAAQGGTIPQYANTGGHVAAQGNMMNGMAGGLGVMDPIRGATGQNVVNSMDVMAGPNGLPMPQYAASGGDVYESSFGNRLKAYGTGISNVPVDILRYLGHGGNYALNAVGVRDDDEYIKAQRAIASVQNPIDDGYYAKHEPEMHTLGEIMGNSLGAYKTIKTIDGMVKTVPAIEALRAIAAGTAMELAIEPYLDDKTKSHADSKVQYKYQGGPVPPMQYGGEIPPAAIEALARLNQEEYDAVRARQLMDQRLKDAPLIDIIGMTGNPSTMGNQPMSQEEIDAVNQRAMMDEYLKTANPAELEAMAGAGVITEEERAVRERQQMDEYLKTANPDDIRTMTGMPEPNRMSVEEATAVNNRDLMDGYLETATPDDIGAMTGVPAITPSSTYDEAGVQLTPEIPKPQDSEIPQDATTEGEESKALESITLDSTPEEVVKTVKPTVIATTEEGSATTPPNPETEVVKAATKKIEEDPSAWEKTKAYFKRIQEDPQALLGDAYDLVADSGIIDGGFLARTALLYLGSRALGYGHTDSLRWSGKQYLGLIQARDKAIAEANARRQEMEIWLKQEGYKQNRLDAREEFKEKGVNERFNAEQTLKVQLKNADLGVEARKIGISEAELAAKINKNVMDVATALYDDGTYMVWEEALQKAIQTSPFSGVLSGAGITADSFLVGGDTPTGTATGEPTTATSTTPTTTSTGTTPTTSQPTEQTNDLQEGTEIKSIQQFNITARRLGAQNIGNNTQPAYITKAYTTSDGRYIPPMTKVEGYVGSTGLVTNIGGKLTVIPTSNYERKDDKQHSLASMRNNLNDEFDRIIGPYDVRLTETTTDGDTRTAQSLSGNRVNYERLKNEAVKHFTKLYGSEEAALWMLNKQAGLDMLSQYVEKATEYTTKYNKPISNFAGFISAINIDAFDVNTGNIRFPLLPKDPSNPVFADIEVAINKQVNRIGAAGGTPPRSATPVLMNAINVLDGNISGANLEQWEIDLRDKYLKASEGKSGAALDAVRSKFVLEHINSVMAK